jgi:hypothetical protein
VTAAAEVVADAVDFMRRVVPLDGPARDRTRLRPL